MWNMWNYTTHLNIYMTSNYIMIKFWKLDKRTSLLYIFIFLVFFLNHQRLPSPTLGFQTGNNNVVCLGETTWQQRGAEQNIAASNRPTWSTCNKGGKGWGRRKVGSLWFPTLGRLSGSAGQCEQAWTSPAVEGQFCTLQCVHTTTVQIFRASKIGPLVGILSLDGVSQGSWRGRWWGPREFIQPKVRSECENRS